VRRPTDGPLSVGLFVGKRRDEPTCGERPPAFNSDDVWDAALEFLGSIDTPEEAEFFEEQSDVIPFSLDRQRYPSLFAMALEKSS
jgi:hypothetical protein